MEIEARHRNFYQRRQFDKAIRPQVRAERKARELELAGLYPRRDWTTREESYLSANYESRGVRHCAMALGRSEDSVKWHWMAMQKRLSRDCLEA